MKKMICCALALLFTFSMLFTACAEDDYLTCEPVVLDGFTIDDLYSDATGRATFSVLATLDASLRLDSEMQAKYGFSGSELIDSLRNSSYVSYMEDSNSIVLLCLITSSSQNKMVALSYVPDISILILISIDLDMELSTWNNETLLSAAFPQYNLIANDQTQIGIVASTIASLLDESN